MAKLTIDHSVGARSVDVPCYVCGKMHQLANSTMDLDGPSFQAYYCPSCVSSAFPHLVGVILPCGVWDCARPLDDHTVRNAK